ncbi:MAG: sensor histidine kinase [Thermoproteota archaeon]|nr:sensor histidine kinase [Thermoproteota archaeon]
MKKTKNTYLRLHYRSAKKTVIIFTVIIILASFTLFFYFQIETETSIINSIFEQQEQIQKNTTRALAQHIQSDLNLIEAKLQGLANSRYLQEGDFSSNDTKNLLENYYSQINTTTPVDRIFLLDKNDTVRIGLAPKGYPTFAGIDFSYREWVLETKNTLSPVFSDSFEGRDGKNRIAITYPIVTNNSKVNNYIGMVTAVIPTSELFQFYGNIYNIESQYLGVLDSQLVQLVHPVSSFIGEPFFGDFTQNATGHNKALNNLIKTVVTTGQPASAKYEFTNGERLNTGHPIFLDGKQRYSVFVVTPTVSIYSKINDIIAKERLQMLSLIAGIIAAVTVLVIFLSKLNSILDREVRKRTEELEESNKKLVSANEQLQINDSLQKEFIHIAAHELRNPVQSILGFSDILQKQIGNTEKYKNSIDIINRNANRLKRLINRILDVTQIDNDLLDLSKDTFNLTELVSEIIKDYQNRIRKHDKPELKVEFMVGSHDKANLDNDIIITADRMRITQVITNLLDNAIEFTEEENGKITIHLEKSRASNEALVKVVDSGIGINQDILHVLFNKFSTRSTKGTGLGLYISKKIIEGHGGKIWAQNNKYGKGATFSFSLPL